MLGQGSLIFFLTNLTFSSKEISNKFSILFLTSYSGGQFCKLLGKLISNQLLAKGIKPTALGSIYTIPQRETVAGEAWTKSSTSNIIVIVSFKTIIALLGKHNLLESSKTLFISSIQNVSTGPSNNIQYFCLPEVSLFNSFTNKGIIPLIHSVGFIGSLSQYNSGFLTALGLITVLFVVKKVFPSFKSLIDCCNIFQFDVFPPPVGPTIIKPCLTWIVSYNWIIFAMKFSWGCRFLFLIFKLIFSIKLSKSVVGFSVSGKRSFIILVNKGISSFKNLGILTSCKALNNNLSSFSSGFPLFNFFAAYKTLFTALIPKS